MTQAPAPIAPGPGLDAFRARAAARLAEHGLPTARLEEWRFTNPAAITATTWAAPAARGEQGVALAATLPRLGAWPRLEAMLAGGRFGGVVAAGSGPLPAGVRIEGLAAAQAATPAAVDATLGTIAAADGPTDAFLAQNGALLADGVFVHLPAGVALEAPLRIAHLPGAPGAPALVPGRVLVELAAGASLVLIEDFRGLAPGADFANAVTEIALGPGASCTLVRLVGELAGGAHVATAAVRAAADARFTASTFATGGPLVRDDLRVVFAGAGAEASLDGLFVVAGQQVVDHHTLLDHAVPRCTSRELYKGVLAGAGRGVFNGAVVIRPDAQKSDSGQRNPNLLLSADATIDTKPELQIHADDVKCAHGATVGQLDEAALFYLRTRGIDAVAARAMLVAAFAREVVDRVAHAGLRADLGAWIDERMDRLARETA